MPHRLLAVVALAVVAAARPPADLTLAALFSDHMVLQRGTEVPIWGWTEPGERVVVEIAGLEKSAVADAGGKWTVRIGPLEPGKPLTLVARGTRTLTVKDVLVGDVWLCSGQSNMAMAVRAAKDSEKEQPAATHPHIRMFTVRSGAADQPQTKCEGTWVACSPETVGSFSATAYFFGRELHRELGVPIGLINSSVGGTAIEAWTSLEAQKTKPELKPILDSWDKATAAYDPAKAKEQYDKQLAAWKEAAAKAKAEGKTAPRRPQEPVFPRQDRNHPGALYNGKIAPLVPCAIRGAIWYQGEANSRTDRAPLYAHQLPLLVRDWRARWGQGDFPFAWVQLPNFEGTGRTWPIVREAMLQALALPNTGMAITIDIGEPKDIHPKNKQDVGRRLAQWALAAVYGRKVASSGPLPASHEFAGSEARVAFKHADGGLVAREGELKGFEVAGPDKTWHPARARIDGDRVIASSPQVKAAAAVRYAWANNPACNLYNGAGLPASPFRTDSWD